MVAFLTVPQDSSGIAHILEHTALCGSRRYPVRDPFFMMIRRSLNTFMNAFTSSDWTAYPFASQNKKDFNNLMDVYLAAAFFPLLDERDFAQEGHRRHEEPQPALHPPPPVLPVHRAGHHVHVRLLRPPAVLREPRGRHGVDGRLHGRLSADRLDALTRDWR